ncbi:MAG: hypothetical protein NTX29_12885 [Actinobacteria bacterium]|nr:hypothetical protein [Actinomycetota bacterium]
MYPDDPWLEAAAGLQVELDAQVRDEAYEVFVAESARVRMVDRVGEVTLLLRCGQAIEGELRPPDDNSVAGHLTVVEDSGRLLLVPDAAVVTMTGSRPGLRSEGRDPARTLGSWLREAWQGDDLVAGLLCDGSWINGRVAHVGADHVDLVSGGCSTTIAVIAVEAWARR